MTQPVIRNAIAPGVAIKRCHAAALSLAYRFPHFGIAHAHIRNRYREVPQGFLTSDTMGVDANGNVYVYPPFVMSLPPDQLSAVIAHELCHLIMLHADRIGTRDHDLWNIAGDMAINHALRKDFSGADGRVIFPLPPDALYPPAKYTGEMRAEPIYDWLQEQGQSGQGDDQGAGDDSDQGGQVGKGKGGKAKVTAGCGVMPAQPGQGEGESGGEIPGQGDVNWAKVSRQIVSAIRSIGTGTSALADLLTPKPGKLDWRRILRHGFSVAASRPGRDAQTMSRRSRRSPLIGAQLPGWKGMDPRVAVVIDVSGSMSREWVSEIVGEVGNLCRQHRARSYLVTHTDRVTWEGWIDGRNATSATLQATAFTGGTHATPAYEAIDALGTRFDALIHFTDCEIERPWPEARSARRLIVGAFGLGARNPWAKPPEGAEVIPCGNDGADE